MKNDTTKTMRRLALACVLMAGAVCSMIGLHTAAYTVDEVAQKAREAGYSEEQVQRGYNEWSSGIYTQEDLDAAYEALADYQSTVDSKIDDIFSSTDTSSTPDTSSGSGTSSTSDTSSDSGTDSKVSSADFINMTLEEKIAYVSAMSDEEKSEFLSNLTTEERNSIIKQMSLSDKADIMQGYVDAASAMGMNMAVDSLSEDGISVTIRDADGVVIDKASVGITIDETGISHTKLVTIACAGIVMALAGFAWIYRCIRRKQTD